MISVSSCCTTYSIMVRVIFAVRLIGDVQHRDRAVVALAQELEPLQEREAARVREQQEVRLGELLARRPDVALQHHPDVALDVGADVLGVPGALGLGDVLARELAHPGLQRVDLRVHRERVEREHELGQVARHEGVHDLACPVLLRARELGEVLRRSSPSGGASRAPS